MCYYSVAPEQSLKGKTVLVLGEYQNDISKKLDSWGFRVLDHGTYQSLVIDFFYIAGEIIDNDEHFLHGYCVGKQVPKLSREFVEDIKKMEAEINTEENK